MVGRKKSLAKEDGNRALCCALRKAHPLLLQPVRACVQRLLKYNLGDNEDSTKVRVGYVRGV